MIHVEKEENVYDREECMTKEQLRQSSISHILNVGRAISWMQNRLDVRRLRHDHTKLEYLDEYYEFIQAAHKNKTKTFVDCEWKDIHLTERHHIDVKPPRDINLFDVMERIADVCMASSARGEDMYEDLVDPQMLVEAYQNTIELLCKNIEVKENMGVCPRSGRRIE